MPADAAAIPDNIPYMSRPRLLRLACLRVAVLSVATTVPLGASEPPPAIIERAISHHGGELFESTRTRFELCSAAGCFGVEAALDGGLFEYVVSRRTAEGERRVRWTNDETEMWLDGEPVALDARLERSAQDWVMGRVYFAFLPYRLLDPGVRWEDRGIVDWEGRSLHEVKVTFEPGTGTHHEDEYRYWFDSETGRLEQFAYSFTSGRGGMRFRTAHDFRRVGGILFFDQENFGIDGPGHSVDDITPDFVSQRMRHVSTVTLERIEVEPLMAR